MRVLISVVAVLFLLNVAAYLWPDASRMAVHVSEHKKDVNPQFIRLNKEIEAKHSKAASIKNTDKGTCYRLGPFMYQTNYELAQAVLFNAGIEFKKSKRTSKESNVYRVYLGRYETKAEVTDARTKLKREKILDHFIRKESEESYIISLGIYTALETAQDALAIFEKDLTDVKIQEESLVLPDSFWLHFVSVSQGAVGQLMGMDWGEQSTELGEHACLAEAAK